MRDLDIRLELKNTYLKKYYNDGQSRVVEELSVCYGDARVDMAVINGSLHGFEIKSEVDTLNRLPNQIKSYSKTFDYLTLITGKSHLEALLPRIPDWCGVVVASHKKGIAGIKLSTYRRAKKNQQIDKLSLAQLLWKNETLAALEELGFNKGLSNKPKMYLWNLLATNTTSKELSYLVRRQLKVRPNWKSEQPSFGNDDCFPLFSKL